MGPIHRSGVEKNPLNLGGAALPLALINDLSTKGVGSLWPNRLSESGLILPPGRFQATPKKTV